MLCENNNDVDYRVYSTQLYWAYIDTYKIYTQASLTQANL